MQIYQTKPRHRHMWIGFDNNDDTIGVCHPVEYENIPPIVNIVDIKVMM